MSRAAGGMEASSEISQAIRMHQGRRPTGVIRGGEPQAWGRGRRHPLVYLATNTRPVFGADDLAGSGGARAVASAPKWWRGTRMGACGVWCCSRR